VVSGITRVFEAHFLKNTVKGREPALASRLLVGDLGRGFGSEWIRFGGYRLQIQPVEGMNEVHQREHKQ